MGFVRIGHVYVIHRYAINLRFELSDMRGAGCVHNGTRIIVL